MQAMNTSILWVFPLSAGGGHKHTEDSHSRCTMQTIFCWCTFNHKECKAYILLVWRAAHCLVIKQTIENGHYSIHQLMLQQSKLCKPVISVYNSDVYYEKILKRSRYWALFIFFA